MGGEVQLAEPRRGSTPAGQSSLVPEVLQRFGGQEERLRRLPELHRGAAGSPHPPLTPSILQCLGSQGQRLPGRARFARYGAARRPDAAAEVCHLSTEVDPQSVPNRSDALEREAAAGRSGQDHAALGQVHPVRVDNQAVRSLERDRSLQVGRVRGLVVRRTIRMQTELVVAARVVDLDLLQQHIALVIGTRACAPNAEHLHAFPLERRFELLSGELDRFLARHRGLLRSGRFFQDLVSDHRGRVGSSTDKDPGKPADAGNQHDEQERPQQPGAELPPMSIAQVSPATWPVDGVFAVRCRRRACFVGPGGCLGGHVPKSTWPWRPSPSRWRSAWRPRS